MRKKPKRLLALLLFLLMVVTVIPATGLAVEAAAKPKLAKKSVCIVIGGTSKIKVKNAPKGAKITYKSAKKSVATVSKQGKVKGIKSGTTKITVSIKKSSKTTKLTYKVTVKKPKLSKSKVSLISGETAKLSIKNKPMKAKYTWLSSNSQIATVSKNGTVTAKTQGNVTIKVKIKTAKNIYTLQCKVTVETFNSSTDVEPTGITLNKSSTSIEEGNTIRLTATVMPSNATNKAVTWSSNNTRVATVSNGNVTGVSVGTATITAKTINNKICICEIQVSTKSEQILDFDKFAQEGAELIKENGEPSSTNIAEEGEFASKRLIVRGKHTQLDFTQFNPKAVVKNNDGIYLIQFASVSATKTALSEISNWPDVDWVELDTYSDVDTSDNVSATSKSWGVSKIGADKYADSISSIRDDMVVAVVDTGVSNHAFLNGRIQSGGFDYVDNDSDPSDKHYHGTHVAGTIVDCTPGLNVKVLPVRVLNAEGRGSNFNVGNGIKYAVDHGAKVINLSLGGSHSNYKDENIEYAINKGVIVVVAAGNENDNTSYHCPAHIDKAIVVAAVDEDDRRAYFSNYGDSVDVAAPGVGIISCIPGGSYRSLNGTSMATPHVAAVVAMFKLKYPSMTPAQIETIVKENVRDLGSAGWDRYYGYGIPNLSNIADIEPIGVTLSQSNVSIKAGDSVTLIATVTPSNATDKTVTWSSNKTSVATVSNGKIIGVSEGVATITARTFNGKTSSCTVNVTPITVEPTGITLNQSSASIKVGGTVTLTAAVSPSNATDKTVTWSSNKISVATVNNGEITGVSEGMATITAQTSNGKTATCTVSVTPTEVEVKDVKINSPCSIIFAGESVECNVTITPNNATDKNLTWKSSNPNVAKVDSGKITGIASGPVTITATTKNGISSSFVLIVESKITHENGWSYDLYNGQLAYYRGKGTDERRVSNDFEYIDCKRWLQGNGLYQCVDMDKSKDLYLAFPGGDCELIPDAYIKLVVYSMQGGKPICEMEFQDTAPYNKVKYCWDTGFAFYPISSLLSGLSGEYHILYEVRWANNQVCHEAFGNYDDSFYINLK